MRTAFKSIIMAAICFSTIHSVAEARRDQRREVRQEVRIAGGAASGELNRKEAKKLRRGQRHIEMVQVKAKSDGVVTDFEAAKIEKMQDLQSKKIYNQKHNEQTR